MAVLYPPTNIAALDVVEESTFGTDPGSGYTRYWVEGLKAEVSQDMLKDLFQNSSGLAGERPMIRGAEAANAKFGMGIYTVAGSEAPLIALAKRYGATEISVAASSSKITGGTSTTFICLTADKGNLCVGSAFIHKPASGTDSMRFIVREQTDSPAPGSTTFTVDRDFATTPLNGDSWGAVDTLVPYVGGQTYYHTMHAYLGHSTQVVRKAIMGCTAKWKFEKADVAGLLKASFEVMSDNWTLTTGTAKAMAARTGNDPFVILGMLVYLDTSALAIKSFDFDPGLQPQWDLAQGGTHGRQGVFFGIPTPSVSISPLFSSDWYTAMQAGTKYKLGIQKFTAYNNAFGLFIPAVEVTECTEEDDGGFQRSAPKLHIVDGGLTTEGTQLPMWCIAMSH